VICINVTPKGENFRNPYGTNPNSNRFSPNAQVGVNLMRGGIQAGKPVTPILKIEKKNIITIMLLVEI
jgi:hypothetical protein